jgi:hypothetical protein
VCKHAALTCASKCLAITVFKKKNQSRSYLNHLVSSNLYDCKWLEYFNTRQRNGAVPWEFYQRTLWLFHSRSIVFLGLAMPYIVYAWLTSRTVIKDNWLQLLPCCNACGIRNVHTDWKWPGPSSAMEALTSVNGPERMQQNLFFFVYFAVRCSCPLKFQLKLYKEFHLLNLGFCSIR